MRGDRPAEALQVEVTERRRLGGLRHRGEDVRPDQDLAGRRTCAQSRGEVGDGSDGTVVVPSLETDPAERRVTRLDPDPETELGAALSPAVRELCKPLLCGEREPHRL